MVLPKTVEFGWFIVFDDCGEPLLDHSNQPALYE